MNQEKENKEKHKCKHCPSNFQTEKFLFIQTKYIHNEIKHECIFCNKRFTSAASLETHLRSHIQESPFFCPKCRYEARNKFQLKAHSEKHKSPSSRFKCNSCPKSFLGEISLKNHVKGHGGKKKFQCTVCKVVFLTSGKRYLHNLRIHNKPRDDLKCSVCGKQFYVKSVLDKHLITHSVREKLKCHLCPKTFLKSKTFEDHINLHKNPEFKYNCDLCQSRFHSQRSYKLHLRNIHLKSNKILDCIFCPKQFASMSRLQGHLLVHTLERPYFCPDCLKEFKSNGDLTNHLQSHSEQRERFKCDLCPKTFYRRFLLAQHVRQHLGEKHY